MTIRQLVQETDGRIYIFLPDEETGKRFLADAEREGFTFGDGAKPTDRSFEEIMAVNPDLTINYVGANGRIAYGAGETVGGLPLVRVDYRRFMNN